MLDLHLMRPAPLFDEMTGIELLRQASCFESIKRIPLLNAGVVASGTLVKFAAGFCTG